MEIGARARNGRPLLCPCAHSCTETMPMSRSDNFSICVVVRKTLHSSWSCNCTPAFTRRWIVASHKMSDGSWYGPKLGAKAGGNMGTRFIPPSGRRELRGSVGDWNAQEPCGDGID